MQSNKQFEAARHAEALREVVRGLNRQCERFADLMKQMPAGSSVSNLMEAYARVLAQTVNVVAPVADFLAAESSPAFVEGE